MKMKYSFLYSDLSISTTPIYSYNVFYTVECFTSNVLATVIHYFKVLYVLVYSSFCHLLNQFCH